MKTSQSRVPFDNEWAPGNARITPTQRDEIRRRRDEGESVRSLAQEFGVSTSTIRANS